ncbi:MAG: glutamate racemase [Saprospiraceae bacterium]|nr:glutamate racemase [Saprospiraceae bacterium]
MANPAGAIGIFDSGIGGLTVAQAIHKLLPNEQLIYIGDTAHMPYGDKSPELIRKYATDISENLINSHQCKALVIACNTASAAAYEKLRDTFKGRLPVINVIDPMVEYIISQNNIKHVGIIATKATVASGVYQEKLARRKKELKFSILATPLLAPMIEEGFYNDNISSAVLHEYLSNDILKDIDSLVLACTHYPLIKNQINDFYNSAIPLLDSAEVVAHKLQYILQKENLLSQSRNNKDEFYVTDYSKHFAESAKIFYGEGLQLNKKSLA